MNRKKLRLIAIPAILIAVAAVAVVLYIRQHPGPLRELHIYGNIDIRQVQVAFNDSDRIRRIYVEEGDRVKGGQLLAELDPVRFQDAVNKAEGIVEEQRQILARLLAGSRPEEIAEARAEVAGAEATLRNARVSYRRLQTLANSQYVSRQDRDNAFQTLKTARADLDAKQQALQLAIKGPRVEDIEAARAALKADEAALALASRELTDTKLYAPDDGVIQDRILEPGDMATPQSPVFTLALDNPVWVRAYLPEQALGRVRLGMKAWIRSDSFPGQRFPGWVGFISPTAEFTPKTVETTELRTELVYRVRVYACNPDHRLRLGMPVTVDIPLENNPPQTLGPHPCRG